MQLLEPRASVVDQRVSVSGRTLVSAPADRRQETMHPGARPVDPRKIEKIPGTGKIINLVPEYADLPAMERVARLSIIVRLWQNRLGQDLIEYALMAGFVAVAAGAIMPNVAGSISTIFSQIGSVMTAASTQGS